MFEFDLFSLALPLAYIIVLVGSLVTFSSIYRKRKAVQSATLAPWFPPHLQRNIYLSLMEMSAESEDNEKAQVIPAGVVRAALIRRAVEDIRRIIQIRSSKQALTTLLARGSIGDDLWQRFLRAEKEMEDELRDVVMEANGIAQGWGQVIFQTANEIAANTELRMTLEETEATLPTEKEWCENRRQAIEMELLGGPSAGAPRAGKAAPKTTTPAVATTATEAVKQAPIVDSTNKEKKKVPAKK